MDSRVTPLQESVELKDRLNQVSTTALNSGNTISDDLFTDLINEFTTITRQLQKLIVMKPGDDSYKRSNNLLVRLLG